MLDRMRAALRPPDAPSVTLAAKLALISHTHNYETVKWLGKPMWQNLADAWTLQESICEDDVDFVIECGTNQGGSAFFLASLFDLLGRGHVATIDIAARVDFTHPRITFLEGSSIAPDVVAGVRKLVAEHGAKRPLVFLDSDHAASHVLAELHSYADLVPVGGYIFVQDGVIDELEIFADSQPGPLVATRQFLAQDDRFEVDRDRSQRYLVSHSPDGWLRRTR